MFLLTIFITLGAENYIFRDENCGCVNMGFFCEVETVTGAPIF